MDALQQIGLVDNNKESRFGFVEGTSAGSLGCWSSPAGLTAGIGFASVSRIFAHETVRILDIHMPTLYGQRILQEVINARRDAARPPTHRLRDRELEWRRTHARELRQYENQWVALEGEEIIAHAPDAAQAIRQAKTRGVRTPYVFFVESESDDSVRIGL